MNQTWTARISLAVATLVIAAACGSSDSSDDMMGAGGSAGSSNASGSGGSDGANAGTSGANEGTSSGGSGGSGGGASQTPPTSGAAVETWLATGAYKAWNCEPQVHAARLPSPHGFNRICSNDLIADNAASAGPWPEGAAAVKELYASATDTTPVGYAVYLKTAADSAAGANWYWYERVPSDSEAPHDAKGVVADGMGDSGDAQKICVGCHMAAGMDAAHTPSKNGHDEVYTPVAAASH